MSSPPPPMADTGLNVQGYDYMPLMGTRLFQSEFYALALRNPRGGLAAQKLWWVAWQQVPAGSLPANEFSLCTLADFGSDMRGWRRARDVAMHGFILCSDGRYYHPVIISVARKALLVREKARDKKARQRAAQAAAGAARHDAGREQDAAWREHAANTAGDAAHQVSDFVQSDRDCPPGRPGSVPAEGKVKEESEDLRSSAAQAAAAQIIPIPEQRAAASVAGAAPEDLFGGLPASEPERPSPGQVLYREGVPKMVEMTGREPEAIKKWFGRMRRETGDDAALILEAVQDTHRRWLKRGDDERADPTGWVAGYVRARAKRAENTDAPVPEFAGPDRWKVSEIVDYCGDIMKVGPDGCWKGFSHVIAEALDKGADPDRHIYPVMRDVHRRGWRTVNNAGFFAFAIAGRRRDAA